MILSCNSCAKRFVIPDQAVTAAGRMVQCGSCGNKWKQFPVKNEVNKVASFKKIDIKVTIRIPQYIKTNLISMCSLFTTLFI